MPKKYYYSHKLRSTIPRSIRPRSNIFNENKFSYKPIIYIICLILTILLIKSLLKTLNRHKPLSTSTLKNISLTLPSLDNQSPVSPPSKTSKSNPYIPAKYAFLIDTSSKTPLYKKKERRRVPIASTTKIMTAIITLEEFRLNDVVTVPQNIYTVPGSKMGLYPKEKITIENLLWGMLLNSGNDAAYTIATYKSTLPGNPQPFVDKMNRKANTLGLLDTKFYDPAGLDDSGYSTAYDLAILTEYALRQKTFIKIVSTDHKTIRSQDKTITHNLKNTNRLVDHDQPLFNPYAIGVKTGYTDNAGHCLVAATRKNGHLLISIILNTYSQDTSESARLNGKLLNWGYANYTWPASPQTTY